MRVFPISLALILFASAASADVGGQTLPSPYYLQDDVQHFLPNSGPCFADDRRPNDAHSPTAEPYIGPFYPCPQVPLGWRNATLEWDDGWWFLDFDD